MAEEYSLRDFLEAAIALTEAKCASCLVPLELVWIDDSTGGYTLGYIHCPSCEAEYQFSYAFRLKRIPKGR